MTNPIYLELNLSESWKKVLNGYILYADTDKGAIKYHQFNKKRYIWDVGFYTDNTWDINERNWEYKIQLDVVDN